ncbi:short-chain dehydrogenase/reductase [Pigmentiphaga litoralis]|uniref:short-chain dehydrogenase/reductase n=1 Tax=Pigmentiphaga litoralis TaxID=516702 RepID=UPI001678CB9C|nr:short-chain dehydrogenase/reductase [Pigmentiphaga litoralis]GGX31295.1 short-chain dehydrogenase/reductase [Pigmentiphaga litoralis]
MDLQLKGKRVLVTGASQGIGYACAMAFAHEGATPLMAARDLAQLELAAAAIAAATGITPQCIPADLSEDGAAQRLADAAGAIDILVNNAGAIPGGSLDKVDDARWRAAWELKLYGYINLVRACLPAMQARRDGVIANIIGMAGAEPRNEYVAGSTANAALMAFTKAVGGASPRDNVRVFGINPSQTRTQRIVSVSKDLAATRLGNSDRWEELTKGLPFGRLMEPEEVASMVVFCCSPRAAYLSGSVIDLDGGQANATPG